MTDRETWLSTIRSNPSDWQAMLMFSDWLEDTEGDLLAAEQWRWIAALHSANRFPGKPHANPASKWPCPPVIKTMLDHERVSAIKHKIRCMPTYPLTIEDVQAYLDANP